MQESERFICKVCDKEEIDTTIERVVCSTCKSCFHKRCVLTNENMVTWTCDICKNLCVPSAPKSRRSKSLRSQHSSTLSQELALKMLEEEKQLMQKTIDEKTQIEQKLLQKSIDQKLKVGQEYLRKKYEVLQAEGSRASGSQMSSIEKVEQWIKSNSISKDDNRKGTSPIEHGPESREHNQVVNTSDVIEVTESKNVDNTLAKALSSTAIGVKTPRISDPEANLQHIDISTAQKALATKSNYIEIESNFTSKAQVDKIKNQTSTGTWEGGGSLSHLIPLDNQFGNIVSQGNGPAFHNEPQQRSKTQRSSFNHDMSHSAAAARKVVNNELPPFSGKSSDWPEFIGAYEFTTEICELSEFENASRLHRSLTGAALTAVKSTLYLPNGASKAIDTLRKLYLGNRNSLSMIF